MGLDDGMERAKEGFFFFLPVLTVILLASLFGLMATLSATKVEATVFTAEEESGTAGQAGAGLSNALLFIIPAVVGSFGIVALIKSGKKRLLKNIFRALLTFATGIMIVFFLYMFNQALAERVWYVLMTPFPFIGSTYTIYYDMGAVFMFLIGGMLAGYFVTSVILSDKFTRKERNGALIVISSLMGAFMAVILPTWTVVFLLLALAVWDIYAVFRGPIKQMVEMNASGNLMGRFDPLGDDDPEFPFENLTYEADYWALGIGDLVFYSVLGAHSFFYSIPYVREEGYWMLLFFFIPVVIAILIGFAYTIYRLTKGGRGAILPGLPVPMFLGVSVFLIMMALAAVLF